MSREVSLMKASRILLLCAAVALPRLVLAANSPPSSPPGAQWLGTVEGILDFCVKVDPKDASAFRVLKKNTSAGLSEHDLAGVRGTREYKDSLHMISDELAKVSPQSAAQTCAAGVAAFVPHRPHTERRPAHLESRR
jgi:hypothetical protein